MTRVVWKCRLALLASTLLLGASLPRGGAGVASDGHVSAPPGLPYDQDFGGWISGSELGMKGSRPSLLRPLVLVF